jgi:glycosyltransferase involved in cell wall biosynthesis
MHILLLEPYMSGSHASWAQSYALHSRHEVEIMSLSGQFWKWRMHGGAINLAKQFLSQGRNPDLILASDMLDLGIFLALTRKRTARIPTAVYFHENQISYPWSPEDRDTRKDRDKHYGFINYTSAYAADTVLFNSAYHREAFLEGLPRLLMHFPDHRDLENLEAIAQKSRVLHLGMDFARFDEFKPGGNGSGRDNKSRLPLILWNHRWEYDKNPEEFFEVLNLLQSRGLAFQVALLGESFSRVPQEFERARKQLGDKIIQYGYIEDFPGYAEWVFKADILPVTSNQDFFGMSVVEAVYCGCFPLLPKRLSYPEIVPPSACPYNYYDDFSDLVQKLTRAVENVKYLRETSLRPFVERFSWRQMAPLYDDVFSQVINTRTK